jgi:hypothetical protein
VYLRAGENHSPEDGALVEWNASRPGALGHVRPCGGGEQVRLEYAIRGLDVVQDDEARERLVDVVVVHGVVVCEIERAERA